MLYLLLILDIFFNRELFPIVRLHIHILLHFTLNFRVRQSPSPVQKFAQMPHLRVIYCDQTALFLEHSLKKTLIKLEYTKFGNAILA